MKEWYKRQLAEDKKRTVFLTAFAVFLLFAILYEASQRF